MDELCHDAGIVEKGEIRKAVSETGLRHTVAEEADALRSVVSMAKSLKPKKLNDQIATLASMDQDGVLEAFIIIARPDQSIASEHRAYLRQNRDKLRLYVSKYVIGKKES